MCRRLSSLRQNSSMFEFEIEVSRQLVRPIDSNICRRLDSLRHGKSIDV
jgi:hypothetical protein